MPESLSSWFGSNPAPLGEISTHWDSVALSRKGTEEGKTALRRLAERYYGPIYRTIRFEGFDRNLAMEMAQRFMVFFCEGKYVQEADPARGSFRAFLKTCLHNFLMNEAPSEARRRGRPIGSGPEPSGGTRAEEFFDREMAWMAFDEAKAAARTRLEDNPTAWEALRRFDLEPSGTHEEVAAALSLDLGEFRRALYHARRALKEEICRILRRNVEHEDQMQEEIQWFLRAIDGGPKE